MLQGWVVRNDAVDPPFFLLMIVLSPEDIGPQHETGQPQRSQDDLILVLIWVVVVSLVSNLNLYKGTSILLFS